MDDDCGGLGASPTPFELDLMARAVRYQCWLAASVTDDLGDRILEVGSGVGTMTAHLAARRPSLLIASEPDPNLRSELERRSSTWPTDTRVRAYDPVADGASPFASAALDTVVSFNVLEHIEDDRAALRAQGQILLESSAPGVKRLIVLAPAHQWAYGEIDRAFDHYRRYGRPQLRALLAEAVPGAHVAVRYLNVFGLPGWYLIGRALRRDSFGVGGVRAMEALLPVLRPIDDALHSPRIDLPLGQSVLGVATLRPAASSGP